MANGKGYFLVANNTAGITQVENGLNASGTYFSEIFDARIQSRFGRLTWNADLGKQSTVSFSVRLGNSDNPDKSWTSWSAPFNDPENSNINTERLPLPAGENRAQFGQSQRNSLPERLPHPLPGPTT